MVWPRKTGYGIKLIRMGCANRPYYQIGAIPLTRRTGLLPDEVIGSLDPVPNERNEIVAAVDLSRLSYWMGRGAELSKGAQTLLGLVGWVPVPPHVYIKAKEEREKLSKPPTKDEDKNDDVSDIDRVIPKKLPF